MKYIISVFLCLVIRTINGDLELLRLDVEHDCIQHCPVQKSTDLEHYDYTCDAQCNIEQCIRGCKLWKEALNSSCPKICNGFTNIIKAKDLYCVIGCNNAISTYFFLLATRLGTPPPPALVADSLNSSSLKLEWNFPTGRRKGLTNYVQWQYEERPESWQNCPNVTWNSDETIATVENLRPYTKYRFRVALIPIHHGDPILSSSSVVISTLPSGVPESSPIIEIPPDINSYVFRNLAPSTNYNVSIRMRNSIGIGPPAQVTISTPPEPLIRGSKKPILILGTEHSVIEQGTYILDEPVVLFETEKKIKGLAVHISKKLLFVSESDGHVAKMTLETRETSYILNPEEINFKPFDLSVDWLNGHLYILGEVKKKAIWQISRCNLDGSGLTVAIAGLVVKPHCVEVDPYNGYLFWAVSGYSKGGLYKLDLADISNGIRHEDRPEMILKDPNLGAFTLDHSNFSLLVARQGENTINSVSFDGKEIYNMRPKVTKSKLHKVVSLATANKIFYWTDGDNVFYEERRDAYYHNSYPDLSARTYHKVIVNLESSQPIPIPVNPPRNLQGMFGNDLAKTTWEAPHLLDGQGRGAWQNWSYEVSLKNIVSNEEIIVQDINTTSCTIPKLFQNTRYTIRAVAYTSYGKGPWSREFIGSTLLNKKENPFIIWAAAQEILMSDPTGQSVKTIHIGGMKNFFITDLAWYKDQIYLVTNDSQMIWYNTSSHKHRKLLDSVGSIGIDWIGKKLYWSNPKQQMMIRGNLNGTQQEPLSISAVAKELEIDSVKAYIYWSTGYAVECAHLNGADKIDYRKANYFSGKQVMGLTLDMDHKNLYWIVRGSEGSTLFKAPMAGYINTKHISVEEIVNLHNPLEGPLSYFHNRLLWLQDNKTAAVSDLSGQNIATIRETTMTDLTTVYVVDPTLHKLPETDTRKVDDIVVIPNIVNRNSVKVIGSSESFNVSWDPVDNVNYGTVFYEVQIDPLSRNDSTVITTFPSIKYRQIVTPYTKLHVSIRAFTYWAASPELKAKIFSPSSTPSAPTNLRHYVVYQQNSDDDQVTITFRWNVPLYPNGIVQGYKVHCWYYNEDTKFDLCKNVLKRSDDMEHMVRGLKKNEIYYFEVRAFTNIGDGKMSETLHINSDQESPLPTLLIASTDSIFVQDIDANRNRSILHGINSPMEMGFLIKENKIFWVNEMQELFMYTTVNSNKTKLLDITGDAIGMTVDWLERSLYFVEKLGEYSIINKIDLNLYENGLRQPVEILRRKNNILKLEMSPFTQKLYWIEKEDDTYQRLMESSADGIHIVDFFSKYQRSKRHIGRNTSDDLCNCPTNPQLASSFSVDHSDIKSKPLFTFIEQNTKDILSADKNGCQCNIIANYSTVSDYFPVKKISSDFGSLYWTNPTQGNLYVLKRQKRQTIESREVKAQDISIFGHHIQPYPPKHCLAPKQDADARVILRQRKSSSLHLILPNYSIYENCSELSLATVKYTVCYSEFNANCDSCEGDCQKLSSFTREVELKNLKSYTKYKIWVSYGNHFTMEKEKIVGLVSVLQTAPGAPSKPLNVTARVLNPTLAEVTWKTPLELNGETVFYEIHWQTEGTRSGVRKKEEQPVLEHQTTDDTQRMFKSLLHKLSPDETYTVWVRAYCETNATSSDSDRVKIVTYPEPSAINLLNKTSHYMYLSWNIPPHVEHAKAQYSSIMSTNWLDVTVQESKDGNIYFSVEDLMPKSFYRFRLCLTYEKHPEEFFWPSDSKFTFETLGDRPSPPGIPIIQYLNPNEYRVWWEAAKENGAPIELYRLEGLLLKHYRTRRSTNRTAFFYTAPSIIEEEPRWGIFYNGTNTSWIIDGLSEEYKYVFRVFALNSFGWSEPSKESIEFDLNETARLADKQSAMTVVVIATGITICFIFIVIIILISLVCTSKKKEPQIIHIPPRAPDVELATLRELPRRGVHNTNVLYISTLPTPEEIKLLPHIKRDQITLTKFLGSGAFGEVFQGKAKDIPGHTKVAIKTLRKGASDQEKSEFLQEAQLMSHFKHEHILELLGVCLDNDPHFIIMELMQGGDLLTYLRSSRNPVVNTPMLTLIELLKMCVDVSKGCRYLEEMHFVHRDLACRNCLVSSIEPETRIVKIGDFGLARDIYKNDYYRKEGEGLLPVRWMAPESLVDGVFTSQSDVWAFGVLLWEIMTLGQQPYPARNNLEVLHYVKGGGRLGKPIDCPVELHSLMLKCWQFTPDNRPTFKYCLEVLENLHQQKLRNPTTGAHEGQYISTVPEYTSWKSDHEDDKEKTPFLSSENIKIGQNDLENMPKYLELLCDPNSSLENDGYEIPNQMLTSTLEKKEQLFPKHL